MLGLRRMLRVRRVLGVWGMLASILLGHVSLLTYLRLPLSHRSCLLGWLRSLGFDRFVRSSPWYRFGASGFLGCGMFSSFQDPGGPQLLTSSRIAHVGRQVKERNVGRHTSFITSLFVTKI